MLRQETRPLLPVFLERKHRHLRQYGQRVLLRWKWAIFCGIFTALVIRAIFAFRAPVLAVWFTLGLCNRDIFIGFGPGFYFWIGFTS